MKMRECIRLYDTTVSVDEIVERVKKLKVIHPEAEKFVISADDTGNQFICFERDKTKEELCEEERVKKHLVDCELKEYERLKAKFEKGATK